MVNTISQLRETARSTCTRPFKARGSIVKRCPQCLLAEFACLCPWQLTRRSCIHFILLIHRKELYKSTNTGRLIADIFPEETTAYLWSRTEPDAALISDINTSKRRLVLLFPDNQAEQATNSNHDSNSITMTDERPLTVILLDGTWRQAAKMANLSPWLQHIPRISLDPHLMQHSFIQQNEQAYIRKASQQHQLSTAQAAACTLRQYGDIKNALLLEHYFSVFNQHCIATRRNIKPEISESHLALTQAKQL